TFGAVPGPAAVSAAAADAATARVPTQPALPGAADAVEPAVRRATGSATADATATAAVAAAGPDREYVGTAAVGVVGSWGPPGAVQLAAGHVPGPGHQGWPDDLEGTRLAVLPAAAPDRRRPGRDRRWAHGVRAEREHRGDRRALEPTARRHRQEPHLGRRALT